MQILNRRDPFKSLEKTAGKEEKGEAIDLGLLKQFYDITKPDSKARIVAASFMWLKANLEQLKECFAHYQANRGENIVALDDGEGTPFHLEKYQTVDDCLKDAQDIILAVENFIKWSIEQKQLNESVALFTANNSAGLGISSLQQYADMCRKGLAGSQLIFARKHSKEEGNPKAVEYLQSAINTYIAISDKTPQDKNIIDKLCRLLASEQRSLGDNCSELKDYPKALDFYRAAIKNLNKVTNKTAEDKNNINNLYRLLAYKQDRLGNNYAELNDYAKALKFHQAAIEAYDAITNKTDKDSVCLKICRKKLAVAKLHEDSSKKIIENLMRMLQTIESEREVESGEEKGVTGLEALRGLQSAIHAIDNISLDQNTIDGKYRLAATQKIQRGDDYSKSGEYAKSTLFYQLAIDDLNNIANKTNEDHEKLIHAKNAMQFLQIIINFDRGIEKEPSRSPSFGR